jgi:hypothetical protein
VTGLLPHRLGLPGAGDEASRASSSALALVFEPDIDPGLAQRDYRSFVRHFVVRTAGLVGAREYRVGTEGPADVDSGPLVRGVSLSASAVALAAARRSGDRRLAEALDAEAELFGLPVTLAGRRRYGFGLLPVGDAFLAWARSQTGTQLPASTPGPRPLWVPLTLLPLAPGALAGALVLVLRRRRRMSPAQD